MPSLTELYDAYVDTFRGADGKLPPMMELKRIHTAHVVDNAKLIAFKCRNRCEVRLCKFEKVDIRQRERGIRISLYFQAVGSVCDFRNSRQQKRTLCSIVLLNSDVSITRHYRNTPRYRQGYARQTFF